MWFTFFGNNRRKAAPFSITSHWWPKNKESTSSLWTSVKNPNSSNSRSNSTEWKWWSRATSLSHPAETLSEAITFGKQPHLLSSAAAADCGGGSVSDVGDGAGAEHSPQGAGRGSGRSSSAAELNWPTRTGQDSSNSMTGHICAFFLHSATLISVLSQRHIIYNWTLLDAVCVFCWHFSSGRMKWDTTRCCWRASQSRRLSLLPRFGHSFGDHGKYQNWAGRKHPAAFHHNMSMTSVWTSG